MANHLPTAREVIDHLIQKMGSKRSYNNVNWMKVLRGFCKYAPPEVVIQVLSEIDRMDEEIALLWPELRVAVEDRSDDDEE